MTIRFEDPPIREDILAEMRLMARQGTTVRALVRVVQSRLGFNEDMYVPVLAYLVRAFNLNLREVLPIREWIGSDKDDEIDAEILPAIERTQKSWLALIPRELVLPK